MQISEITDQIRDIFNNSTIKQTQVYSNKQDWYQFCAGLDAIRDTCLAIENFQKDSTNLYTKHPYLATYGLFQALFIQQDAVNFLKKSIFGKKCGINWREEYPELFKIRQIRNETVGHPIEKKNNYKNNEITYCFITRISLCKEGFSYALCSMDSNTEHKTIKFADIISQQDQHLGKELKTVMEKIQEDEKKHKEKFKNEKLSSLLKKTSLYQIDRIYDIQSNNLLDWDIFNYYHELYKQIRKGLEDRYGNIDESLRIEGTKPVIRKLDIVFSKIETFQETGNYENLKVEAYIESLEDQWNELGDHLVEVDQEFEIGA